MGESGRGRARSAEAREAILGATVDLVIEGGYAALSIEHIAARAGVGKQTIYRWWPSKSDVLAECVTSGLVIDADSFRFASTGDVSSDIGEVVTAATSLMTPEMARMLRALAAAAAENDVVRVALYEHLTGPVERLLAARLESAGGVVPASLLAQSVIGVILYRLLTEPGTQPPSFDDLTDLIH